MRYDVMDMIVVDDFSSNDEVFNLTMQEVPRL